MIRLGLRVTLGGGRDAGVRLAVTAAAVALGAGLLLFTLAGINAVNTQNARYAWLSTGAASPARPGGTPASGTPASGTPSGTADPLWWLLRGDYFDGQVIGRIDVAATGAHSPVPPGIPRLPRPGQFYASPALSRLLSSVPAAELGGRFPGRQAGTIGPAALPAPDSLIIVIGHSPRELSTVPGARLVSAIQDITPSSCNGLDCLVRAGINANGIDLILSVVACALLFPVLIFLATATRLSAARREQRFAAMRLAGATPRQVSVISAVESAVAAVAGTAAGFGLFALLRPAVAAMPFTGAPFFPGDLSLSPLDIVLVAIGIPVTGAAAARLALRRVQISPLGVSRRVTPPPPRAYRVIPLLAGIAELAFFVAMGRPGSTPGQVRAYLPGFLLITVGLVIAGPWLTMAGSRVMAARTRRPAALIAARRLADNPRAGFRAISGLVLALFVTAVAVGVITTMDAERGPASLGPSTRDILIGQFAGPDSGPRATAASVPADVLARLRSIRGVHGVTTIHTDPLGTTLPDRQTGMSSSFGPQRAGLVSCAELSRTPALGRCPAGAQVVAIPSQVFPLFHTGRPATVVWPAAAVPAQRLQRLPVQSIVVTTNGSVHAIEQARVTLEDAYPDRIPPATVGEILSNSELGQYQRLAEVVVLASLAIAGCTLAASVAAGLSDRKRPFSLLRLTGVPLGMLRRVVALESAVPLVFVAVVATGTGFIAAGLFVRSQLHYSLRPPGPEYYAIVAAGLAASLGIIASTFPLLKRITGPETARNE